MRESNQDRAEAVEVAYQDRFFVRHTCPSCGETSRLPVEKVAAAKAAECPHCGLSSGLPAVILEEVRERAVVSHLDKFATALERLVLASQRGVSPEILGEQAKLLDEQARRAMGEFASETRTARPRPWWKFWQ